MSPSCVHCPYSKKRPRLESDEYYTTLPKGASVLSQDIEDLKGVYYRPRTKESRATYELLLSFIQHSIGDQVRRGEGERDIYVHVVYVHVVCVHVLVYEGLEGDCLYSTCSRVQLDRAARFYVV